MRTPLAVLLAAATACTVVAAGSAGSAQALGSIPTSLPTVSVPVPTPTVSVPVPTPSLPVDVPTTAPTVPGTGGGGGGSGGSGGSGSTGTGSGSTGTDPGSTASGATGTSGAATTKAEKKAAARLRQKQADDSTPMVAGTAAAEGLLDDESSPAMRAANERFLTADRAIAEIARRKRVMAGLKAQAVDLAQVYRAIDLDVTTAEAAAKGFHERYDQISDQWDASTREAYVTGQTDTDAKTVDRVLAALQRYGDGSARAELRVGSVVQRRELARADFQKVADRYNEVKDGLDDVQAVLDALAEQRSTALQAVQAAKGSDIALQKARIVESGALGAQIRSASAALESSGQTVKGTGQFASPLEGRITSPYGMRLHPILHYTKLHTGTDMAGGSAIHAVDDGRVIMTVASTAYGNFTVIDHGVLNGKRVTTAYAHQAQFLVQEGQQVAKGQQIGVVGATGYATGPHLHLEVREDGAVVDPMTWLGRR